MGFRCYRSCSNIWGIEDGYDDSAHVQLFWHPSALLVTGTLLDLAEVAARAATLSERLTGPAGISTPDGEARANSRLARWAHAAAGGDPAMLERRLKWDGISLAQARDTLSTLSPAPALGQLPEWATTAGEIMDQAMAIAVGGWHDPLPAPVDPAEPLPFEELLLPAVLLARYRFASRLASLLGKTPDPLSPAAKRDLERALLDRLCTLAAPALYAEFARTVPVGRGLRRFFTGHATGDGTSTYYRAMVTATLGAGLAPIFASYPVLARLLATAIDQWVDTTTELVLRVAADNADLRNTFDPENGQTTNWQVIAIRPHLSDFHREGRSVSALTFKGGTQIMYKPKCLALEAGFGDLLTWCNARGAMPPLTAPQALDRGAYGFVACVVHEPCADAAAAARLYERAGMLLAILHAVGGTDCHRENLIVAGEQFMLVDLETLMHHEARPMSDADPTTDAMRIVHRHLRDSILRTGLVPRWDFASDGEAYDVSGLAGANGRLSARTDRRWRNVNSDDMDFGDVTVDVTSDASTPLLRGIPLSAGDYLTQIMAGFERMYRLLTAHRDELLAPGAPVDRLLGCLVRFIFRPTLVYAMLRDRALAPDALRDGIDRSIELEALARGFLTSSIRPTAWPIFRAEMEAMERLDVPLFSTTSASDAFPLDTGIVLNGYFEAPSHTQMVAQLSRLDEEDLLRQLEILRLAFNARAALESAEEFPPPVTATPPSSRAVFWQPTTLPAHPGDGLVQGACAIAEEIAGHAVRGNDGSAAWLDVGYTPLADRFQLQPMGLGLYDGIGGIALFLAALERVTGDRRFHELILGALLQVRRFLGHPDRTGVVRVARLIGLGGLTGLGSLIYVLVRVAELIGEQSLVEDAARAANLIDSALLAADEKLDVMSGAAGALLGLLVLHEASADSTSRDKALACARKLVERPVSIDGAPATWRTLGGRQLAGFSHGAAGIAHALLRAYEVFGDREFLKAATEGIDYERSVYSFAAGNWPDLRRDGAPRFLLSWCNGAGGIALARTAAASVLGIGQVQNEIERAALALETEGWGSIDHLCCGNAGRVEALLVASQTLSRPHWYAAARTGAAALLSRSASPSRFGLFANVDGQPYSPGFFRGTSGIGYQLLRVARPDLLQSVLLLG